MGLCDLEKTELTGFLCLSFQMRQLIPEFFQPTETVEDNFLLNARGLDLGVRQSAQVWSKCERSRPPSHRCGLSQDKVNDVTLPNWAAGMDRLKSKPTHILTAQMQMIS